MCVCAPGAKNRGAGATGRRHSDQAPDLRGMIIGCQQYLTRVSCSRHEKETLWASQDYWQIEPGDVLLSISMETKEASLFETWRGQRLLEELELE